MGWTWYQASYYKNGKIDRKAECDDMMNSDMVTSESQNKIGKFEVLKSIMVGSTYYAAIRKTKFATETEPETSTVFAEIILTSTDKKEYFNFGYKDMDETVGPYQCNCPKSILDLLSPTESEWANNWRKNCRDNLIRKQSPTALNKLSVGTCIEWTVPCDLTHGAKKGDKKILHKSAGWGKHRPYWTDGWYRYSTKLIGDTYTMDRNLT